MNLNDCRTIAERDVLVTYRRHLRRKGATEFSAQASALAEEMGGGASLSPEFIDRFTGGTRQLVDGRLRLTPKGRAVLENMAGIGQDPDVYHYWTTCGDYVRAGCGLVRSGLKQEHTNPPQGALMCPVCEEVSTVERTVNQ
jgi:hypothetical protein